MLHIVTLLQIHLSEGQVDFFLFFKNPSSETISKIIVLDLRDSAATLQPRFESE
jgi:hypothetical protein